MSQQPDTGNDGSFSENDVRKVMDSLWFELPRLARKLVSSAQYPPHERNENFLKDPDDLKEHETKWHQWGIITHSRVFEKYYLEEVPVYLKRWGVAGPVAQRMSESIDGVSKNGLLRISIPFHDLGKFTARKLTLARENTTRVSFKGHEKASGEIIREPAFSRMLRTDYGLTERQVEYIAQCAERHYVLAIVREEAKKRGTYNLTYVHSAEFDRLCRQQMQENAGFELEVGLLWLADSLAKIEIRIEASTDEELNAKENEIRALLKKRGLKKLLRCARQVPINIAVAERYLKLWQNR